MSTSSTGRSDVSGSSSREIRDDIRRTRAEMDETVEALSDRLRPRHLLDDLLDVFRSKAGGTDQQVTQNFKDAGSAVLGKLKHNPMPAALIGAGIAWLLFDTARGDGQGGGRDGGHGPYGRWRDEDLREYSGSFVDARTGEPYDESYGAEFRRGGSQMTGGGQSMPGGVSSGGMMGGGTTGSGMTGGMTGGAGGTSDAGSSGPGMMDKAKEKIADVGRSISDATSSAVGSVRDMAGSAASSVRGSASGAGSAMSGMGGRMGEWSGSAYESSRRGMSRGYEATRQTFEESLNRYPLAMGAAALAAGVLTGLLLPETRRENELMGEQSDRLKEQVKDTGQDLLDRGKQVASATAGAVAGEAEQQGLAPGSLAEKARNVVRDTMEAAKESAHREGLDDLGQKAKNVAQRGAEVAKDETAQQKDQLS